VRATCRSARDQLIERQAAPGPDFTALIETRDLLRVLLKGLTDKQRRTVTAWACGSTIREIAREEGIGEAAAHERLSSGLRKLRKLADQQ
jgi:DNA-directed RNA polymerase specialized sigma24 family protein